ncbi:MAG: hypothetical protein QNL78_03650 [Actinomycetes bacterium]
MAILALPPLIRPHLAVKVAKGKAIDSQTEFTTQKLDTGKFILLMACAVTINLLVIAGINILMTQDAFTLQKLKSQRNIALDEKDAILNLVNEKNSPVNLSKTAIEMGMIPASKIGYLNYLDIDAVVVK